MPILARERGFVDHSGAGKEGSSPSGCITAVETWRRVVLNLFELKSRVPLSAVLVWLQAPRDFSVAPAMDVRNLFGQLMAHPVLLLRAQALGLERTL